MNQATQRRSASPIRLTMVNAPGEGLDGAWWPRTPSIARELPQLIDALRASLGQIVDLNVNWSSANAVPDLDMLTRRGIGALPGWKDRPQRVMCVTGETAKAKLLVVPCHTTPALAVMVLRHAAGLPVDSKHYDSARYLAAFDIVEAARTVCAQQAT
ncbi:hypothetical protein SAMN04489835_0180 [Mycolicibacterium rutilum]|uniref:Uncharacterized protein n=1 Tax=Mycolicibacterium rutilum TaxID=370526 RepID=A0A1H6IIP5_MYCRU|nr:DUF5994 family protein [Mycolicibacterium rutilum]SEH47101.1 hypothetical protein SAMN04489835_0180 [Mycolicibacterium rutilum]